MSKEADLHEILEDCDAEGVSQGAGREQDDARLNIIRIKDVLLQVFVLFIIECTIDVIDEQKYLRTVEGR